MAGRCWGLQTAIKIGTLEASAKEEYTVAAVCVDFHHNHSSTINGLGTVLQWS